jgi:hypothetical protein
MEGMAQDRAKHYQNETNYQQKDFIYRKECANSENVCMIERIEVNGTYEKS